MFQTTTFQVPPRLTGVDSSVTPSWSCQFCSCCVASNRCLGQAAGYVAWVSLTLNEIPSWTLEQGRKNYEWLKDAITSCRSKRVGQDKQHQPEITRGHQTTRQYIWRNPCRPQGAVIQIVESYSPLSRRKQLIGKLTTSAKRGSPFFPPHIMPFMALTVVNPNWNLFADPSNRISAGGLAIRNYRFTTLQQVLGLLDEGWSVG